jgi:hypothetical protein
MRSACEQLRSCTADAQVKGGWQSELYSVAAVSWLAKSLCWQAQQQHWAHSWHCWRCLCFAKLTVAKAAGRRWTSAKQL